MRLVACSLVGLLAVWSPLCAAAPRESDEQLIRSEAQRARTWRYSWTGINASLAVGSFVALSLDDDEARPDWIVGGTSSVLTALATWFMPLRVESAAQELEALPPLQRRLHVRRLLQESAEDEHDRVTWPWHVANVGLSALAGGIIAFGYDRYESGLITALVGTALCEAQLLTQPTGLPRAGRAELRLVPNFRLLRAGRGAPLSGGIVSVFTQF